MTDIVEEILEFWLADADSDVESVSRQSPIWWQGSQELDEQIRQQFGSWLEQAGQGGLASWRETARGSLALVILLDQFSRNIHRGTPRAFASDPQALELSQSMQSNGQLGELGIIGKVFALMPMEHAEDIEVQQASVSAFEKLAQQAPAGYEEILADYAQYARLHRDIVVRFGRFPHRNRILGRESTEAEAAWLADGAPTFGQG